MTTLTIAFTPEGTTDERFLGSIISRTIQQILTARGRAQYSVLPPTPFTRPKGDIDGAERLLKVAQEANGYHLLVIHADADDNTPTRAINERIQPGVDLINSDGSSCQDVVAIVPVHMSEAWMFADHEMLQEALNTKLNLVTDLHLPRPGNSEKPADPKKILEDAIRIVQAERSKKSRSQLHISDLYSEMSEIELSKLDIVPSYQQFKSDLSVVLKRLNFIT